jgi:hypothetical protein
MALGPGKYDHVCTLAREQAKAEGALLIVFGGEYGDGFSMQAPMTTSKALPAILRMVADDIERDQLSLWRVH